MSITFTAKNLKIPGPMKAYVEKSLSRIERISGDIIDADVIIHQEKLGYRVEMSIKTRNFSYHLEEQDPILKQALRTLLNTFKSQAKKNKEKIKEEKKRMHRGDSRRAAPPVTASPRGDSSEEKPQVTLSNNFSPKPLSIEEAIFYLHESGDNAYLFVNADTNHVTAVYFNRKGKLSLIEANQ